MTAHNKYALQAFRKMEKGREYTIAEIDCDWPSILHLQDKKRIRCVNPGNGFGVTHIDNLRFVKVGR